MRRTGLCTIMAAIVLLFADDAAVHAQGTARSQENSSVGRVRVGTTLGESSKEKKMGVARVLRAGPLSMQFRDGELRYIYLADREIVRRVYFAVRNGAWGTVMPQISNVKVSGPNINISATGEGKVTTIAPSFEVAFDSKSDDGDVSYEWTTKIVGAADGTITYSARAKANKEFKSNRIGICVLYGSEAVQGLPFTTTAKEGVVTEIGQFPRDISPTLTFWAKKYTSLRYPLAEAGLDVETAATGAVFDMEDQRWFGDSSFKAYAPIGYKYPNMETDAQPRETSVTIRLVKTDPTTPLPYQRPADSPITVTIGYPIPEVTLPQIAFAEPNATGPIFAELFKKDVAGAETLSWGFSPSVHLFDNDTFMENLSVLTQQASTARSLNKTAKLIVTPISLNKQGANPTPDARMREPFGKAWSLLALKELAFAGVSAATFALPTDSDARKTMEKLVALRGKPLMGLTLSAPPGRKPVDALAIATDTTAGVAQVFLVNRTDLPQTVTVSDTARPGKSPKPRTVKLKPYGVEEFVFSLK